MDVANAAYGSWSETADRLAAGRPGGGGLIPLLEAIRAGIRLRRELDERGYDGSGTSAPLMLRRQIELEQVAHRHLTADASMAAPIRAALSAHVEAALRQDQAYLGQLLTRPDLDAPARAFLLDRFRHDLRWAGILVACLEETHPPLPNAMAEADLNRLRRTLEGLDADAPHQKEARHALLGRWGRLSVEFLGRQVEAESTAEIADDATAADLWARRLRLSRLQARIEALAESPDEETPPDLDARLRGWAGRIAARRSAMAELAEARLDATDADLRGLAWEGIALSMQGEANDIHTDLEELRLPESVRLLALAREDLDALAQASRKRARERPDPFEARGIRGAAQRVGRLQRMAHNEWQERRLALRLERRLGRRFVTWMENTILVLILVVTVLITVEMTMEATGSLTAWQLQAFAWADLAICSVFLAEFGLKLALAPERFRYFRRHFLVDFLASIPFGFLAYFLTAHHVAISKSVENIQLLRLLRFGRLTRLVRYVRLARPLIRLGRILIFALRFTDRLVRRYGGLLNQNIILFESDAGEARESRPGHMLASLRRLYNQRVGVVQASLDADQRGALAEANLADLEVMPDGAAAGTAAAPRAVAQQRAIPVESVVEHLIELTPEQLLEERGPEFVESIDRYIRLFDAPLVRRLPIIRDLVAYRESGPAEGVALAANLLGTTLQGVLNVVYYVADLQATISPPLFLDRLGATIIGATQRPAKRLLSMSALFLILFVVVYNISILGAARPVVDKLQTLLGWPVIILGLICLVFWMIGVWLRKIANQAADFCDRVAEAQFASQTRKLKVRKRETDFRFLHHRVIAPELALRAADDRDADDRDVSTIHDPTADTDSLDGTGLTDNELLFLGNIRLLYDDYLEGAPLHRTDTKTTNQLLGNLALVNLRRSHLGYAAAYDRRLNRLDLSRAGGGVLGGPYLWFNYITRMIVQETAKLLVDYNLNAIPLDRLACSPEWLRERQRAWLAGRLGIGLEEVELPPRQGGFDDEQFPRETRRKGFEESFENVEFTAIDFLAHDPGRDRLIRERYGARVLELLHKDRRRIVRRAFRSYPLHDLPRAQRTLNLYTLYKSYVAGGRVLVLPLVMLWRGLRTAGGLSRSLVRVIGEILHPRVGQGDEADRPEPYNVALRKIHRMRKPAFMESLRLRAAFDVEYLGLPLPSAPYSVGTDSLMERDLDNIGAGRRDRLEADRIRRRQGERLARVAGWLARFGWTFPNLIDALERDLPFLADRSGEALRALATAAIIDYDDIYTLGASIDALREVLAYAADPNRDPRQMPPGLPAPLTDRRGLWRPSRRGSRPTTALFDLPCFPNTDPSQHRRMLRYLQRHRRVVDGWIQVVLGQGGDDPWETVQSRLRQVLLRTDLWSDQIIVLRAIQTLTLLDVHHYCDLVRELGDYECPGPPMPHPHVAIRPDVPVTS